MSNTILVMGESGSGKTTSMRLLDPKQTYYIDCDKKGLSWKGWKSQYNSENKNYIATSDVAMINKIFQGVSDTRPEINTIVVDTLNGIMIDDEMNRMKEKGYDKWADLAQCVWFLVADAQKLRDDMTVVFTAHTQTERDDNGFMFTRAKTSGKKLDKIVLESKFTTVLISKCVDGKYVFETQSRNSTAKSPMDCFEEFTIDNDIAYVIKKLKEYETEEPEEAKKGTAK